MKRWYGSKSSSECEKEKRCFQKYPVQIPLYWEYEQYTPSANCTTVHNKTTQQMLEVNCQRLKTRLFLKKECPYMVYDKKPKNGKKAELEVDKGRSGENNIRRRLSNASDSFWCTLRTSKSRWNWLKVFQSQFKDNKEIQWPNILNTITRTEDKQDSDDSSESLPLAQSTPHSYLINKKSALSSAGSDLSTSSRAYKSHCLSKSVRDHYLRNYKRKNSYTTNIYSIGNKYAYSKSQEQLVESSTPNAIDYESPLDEPDHPWIMLSSGFKFSVYGWPISRVTLHQTDAFCASAVTIAALADV